MGGWLWILSLTLLRTQASLGRALSDQSVVGTFSHGHVSTEVEVPQTHVSQFPKGSEAVAWLSDDNKVIPELAMPPEGWSSKLVIGYAGSYNAEILKPLIYSVIANADPESMLVLFCPQGDNLHLSEQINHTGRVFVQEHAMPEGFGTEDLPYPVSLRFYVAKSFLKSISHQGTTVFLDTRDVFIQKDPFSEFSDGIMHFPRESGAYRLKGPYTWNFKWILNCYGNETLSAIGGNYVLNSGTLVGPSIMMRDYFDLLTQEMENRWQCRREHGSDQAMHNFLVYNQKVSEAGIKYEIEDQVQGRFAFMAYTHPALWEFRHGENGREEMYNRGEGKAYVFIHMWPGDNRVDKNIIRPFVREFDRELHGENILENLGQ